MTNFKPGDKVHLGFGTKGGVGFNGTLEKIEGDVAYIKNEEGRTFKGSVDRLIKINPSPTAAPKPSRR